VVQARRHPAHLKSGQPEYGLRPPALVFRRSFAVPGSRAPNEMSVIAARKVSAGDGFICACAEAEPARDRGNKIAKTTMRVFCQSKLMPFRIDFSRVSRQAGEWLFVRREVLLVCRVPALRASVSCPLRFKSPIFVGTDKIASEERNFVPCY
jgi:hypothetical protein